MVRLAILALVCSTAPTSTPVSEWPVFAHQRVPFTFRYPVCWNLQHTVGEGTDWIHLSSPDGAANVTIRHDQDSQPPDLASWAAEVDGELSVCELSNQQVPCVKWNDRSGSHQRIYARSGSSVTSFSSSELGEGDAEAIAIHNSVHPPPVQ
jgi:hypothetical protein